MKQKIFWRLACFLFSISLVPISAVLVWYYVVNVRHMGKLVWIGDKSLHGYEVFLSEAPYSKTRKTKELYYWYEKISHGKPEPREEIFNMAKDVAPELIRLYFDPSTPHGERIVIGTGITIALRDKSPPLFALSLDNQDDDIVAAAIWNMAYSGKSCGTYFDKIVSKSTSRNPLIRKSVAVYLQRLAQPKKTDAYLKILGSDPIENVREAASSEFFSKQKDGPCECNF